MSFGRNSRLRDVMKSDQGRGVLERKFPEWAERSMLDSVLDRYPDLTVGVMVHHHPGLTEVEEEDLWAALAAVRSPATESAAISFRPPRADYEGDEVARGSAVATYPSSASRWSMFELVLAGPSHGNPFTEVELTARFSSENTEITAGGFYNGDGRWVIRFLPEDVGRWRFVTSSNARSLSGVTGEFDVTAAAEGSRGPVHAQGFHFAHADGTRHLPLGTTAYAWLHQPAEVRAATLRTLSGGPFSKLRMTVFPKGYAYNSNEPDLFPFPGNLADGFDFTRFNPEFFRRLESAVAELGALGIEADLILFHPYDRWGFAEMGEAVDELYVRYIVRRLWALPNVWWSMANEYDFVWSKSEADWEQLARLVVANDPAGHLLGIHNGFAMYDHTRDWVTHASVQRVDAYRTAENVDDWRRQWGKPVVVDECAYEGDLDDAWGNISGRELTRRFWEGALRGGYVGHSEAYYREDEQIWWAKGGELIGESPARIGFLRRIIEEAPGGVLEPISSQQGFPVAGIPNEYYLEYYGFRQPIFRNVLLPPGRSYRLDVIDTWNMTVETLPGKYAGEFRIELPGREFIALRMTVIDSD